MTLPCKEAKIRITMLLNLLIGISLCWLAVLSFFLFKTISHYNNLTKGIFNKNLTEVLENLLKEQKLTTAEINKINSYYIKLKESEIPHVQKIGLVRFNPFTDTGGNQSFALALLDGKNEGIVISSLHSRSQTRWYAKTIKDGKSDEYELSSEEKKAIEEAIFKKG